MLYRVVERINRLGIHSEMVPDGAIDLIERGVVNGERKTLHHQKVIAG